MTKLSSWPISLPISILAPQNCSSQITAKVIVLQWKWVISIAVWIKTTSFPWYSTCWRNSSVSLSSPILYLFFFLSFLWVHSQFVNSSNTLPGPLQVLFLLHGMIFLFYFFASLIPILFLVNGLPSYLRASSCMKSYYLVFSLQSTYHTTVIHNYQYS